MNQTSKNDIKMKYAREFSRTDKNHLEWNQLLWILEDNSIVYHFFRNTPYFDEVNEYDADGNLKFLAMSENKHRMAEHLEKLGWECGLGGLTWKEGLINEISEFVSFFDSYMLIYNKYVGDDPYKTLSITISEFLNEVLLEQTKKLMDLKAPETLSQLIQYLEENKFIKLE